MTNYRDRGSHTSPLGSGARGNAWPHRLGQTLCVLALLIAALPAVAPHATRLFTAPIPHRPDVLLLADKVRASDDNRGLPFVIVDKVAAEVAVFDALGNMLARAPALLGQARGDDSVPGIGERPIDAIMTEERTTPAGRFVAEPGRNLRGEDIVWVDYDAAISLHRVRANNPAEKRLQRLASPTPADNRISYGCINVPATFFETVVGVMSGYNKVIVYVVPEVKNLTDVFAFTG